MGPAMTLLQRETRTVRPDPSRALGRARALVSAALAGALAAVLSAMVVTVPVLVAWFADPAGTVTLGQAVGVGIDLWALAHRAQVSAGGVSVVLAPLLLTLVPLLCCRYAVGQVLVDRPDVRGELRVVSGWRAVWRAVGGAELGWFTLGYLACGVALCVLAGLGQAQVAVPTVLPGLVLVPLAAVTWALVSEHRRQEQPTIDAALRWIELRTPVLVRRGLRPAAQALAGLLVLALLLLVALVVMRTDRIGTLYGALDAGPVGVVVLTLAQLLLLPNLLAWALGWTTGAGFAVGTVHVGWTEVTSGDLPLVPVLAALPEPGPLPPWLWAAGVGPLLAGVWLGWRAVRLAPRLASWWAKAQIAGSACLLVALAALALSALATGGLTPGLLGRVGTDPLVVAGLLLAELLAGAVATLTLLHLTRRRL